MVMLFPATAAAQAPPQGFGETLIAALTTSDALLAEGASLLVLSLGLGVLAWWQSRRRRASERETEALADQVETLRAAMAAGPDTCFAWLYRPPRVLCARRLAVLLNLPDGTTSDIGAVVAALRPDIRPALTQALDRLRQDGTPFSLETTRADGERRLDLRGLRVHDATDNRPLADVLWVRDVTDDGRAVDRLAREAARQRAEADRLRAVLHALPLPVWVRDGDLALIFCNAACARMIEAADAADAVALGRDLAVGEVGRDLRALAARSRAVGAPLSERVHLVVDGARRLMDVTEAPFLDDSDGGQDRLTAGVAQDSTALEDLDNRLTQEQAGQAAVLDRLSTAIAIFGPDTRLSYHNPAFARLWRLDPAWLDRDGPGYGALLNRLRDQRALPEVADYPAFRTAEVGRFTTLIDPLEDLIHLPDGKTLRRVITPQPKGGLLFTYEDVTDALSLERSYNTLSAVQRETLDHLHEAVAVFGADGRLKLANPAFEALWGAHAADPELALPLSEFMDLQQARFADETSWRHHRFAVLAPPSHRAPHRGRVTPQGAIVLDYACVPLPDSGVLLSYNDVSDTARVEHALRERAATLSAASMLRADFIASLSYELRTPLTTIAGFSEMLSAEYHGHLNAQQIDYAQSIAETARDMITLLDDTADLVAIEAGRAGLEVAAFDIADLVARVMTVSRDLVRRRAVAIQVDCPPDIGWMVGDADRIRQILTHLMGRAIRACAAGGHVTARVARAPAADGSEVRGSDGEPPEAAGAGTGPGDQGLERIVFSVGDDNGETAGRRLAAGADLGDGGSLTMLLVRRFTEMHGGTMTLQALPGTGTTVICSLPSGRADTMPQAAADTLHRDDATAPA
ncbi:signal transduction histidine kinase/PAS domain-containing protein [Roseospira visakhapatnamensis]|uniref:histidine kinase n=2 Tax=Roseospira visakhapatnamensis TaxID=390880 RepID=A0A7W6RA02_9PROT|nr:signal transduction histidine kinase/PAS domain-containing protein [Roseospira visakhapatnamensis]